MEVMQSNAKAIKVWLDSKKGDSNYQIAANTAINKGIPAKLLQRKFLIVHSTEDFKEINSSALSKKSQLFILITGIRFSLPSALFTKYIYLTGKQYSSYFTDEEFEKYLYFVIDMLYRRESGYEFLENEIEKIEETINSSGTFNSLINISDVSKGNGTISEHLIFCYYMIMKNLDLDNKDKVYQVINIIIHIPFFVNLQARSRSIASPSLSHIKDWELFVAATCELFKMVLNVYNEMKEDYWKTFAFFVNNNLFEIADIFYFSNIDEEAVKNWVSIPKVIIGQSLTLITNDTLNYLKWTDISRY